uniref:HNH domain-containing protein n=1 Tax=Sinocyclocheilus rhinocerous TaxID=307959 RepID=A0A673HIW7_9TELE
MGQTTTIHIHYLIAKGTFDTVIWAMLNRKVGDQEKWVFLNLAQAWTPSDTMKGDSEDDKDGTFFSHFEKDKQHDIRLFFSPSMNKEKKRKRTGDSHTDGSPLPQSPRGRSQFGPRRSRPMLTFEITKTNTPLPHQVHTQKESDNSVPVYDCLKFCASKNTDRIYIYDKDGLPLHCNFIPLDIRLQNWEELPPEFNHSENRRQVVRFVREWSSLTAMRQRMGEEEWKSFSQPHPAAGGAHTIPALAQQHLQARKHTYTIKAGELWDLWADLNLVEHHRTITEEPSRTSQNHHRTSQNYHRTSQNHQPTNTTAGYLQAVDSAGTPLCLSCRKPSGEHHGWAGGFCSPACTEDFQLRSNQGYMRTHVLEKEQGVCQHCGLNAHQLYVQVRDAPRIHRNEMLDNTWLAQLPLKQVGLICRTLICIFGHFFLDHINPVYRGGGQCSLVNLQTLCTVCHRMRTTQQAKDRSQMKRDQAASKLASDITRFFVKK